MTPETSRLIAETLRLDHRARVYPVERNIYAVLDAAPRLARITKMQAEYIEWAANQCHSTAPSWLAAALVGAERQALPLQHVGRYVLTEIEKIAKGESDGIE